MVTCKVLETLCCAEDLSHQSHWLLQVRFTAWHIKCERLLCVIEVPISYCCYPDGAVSRAARRCGLKGLLLVPGEHYMQT